MDVCTAMRLAEEVYQWEDCVMVNEGSYLEISGETPVRDVLAKSYKAEIKQGPVNLLFFYKKPKNI